MSHYNSTSPGKALSRANQQSTQGKPVDESRRRGSFMQNGGSRDSPKREQKTVKGQGSLPSSKPRQSIIPPSSASGTKPSGVKPAQGVVGKGPFSMPRHLLAEGKTQQNRRTGSGSKQQTFMSSTDSINNSKMTPAHLRQNKKQSQFRKSYN